MKIITNIAKSIGVIVLSMVLFFIGQIVGDQIASILPGPTLNYVIGKLLRTAVTVFLAWLLSSKLLKIDADELGIKPKKINIALILLAIALPVSVLIFYTFVLPGSPSVTEGIELAPIVVVAIFRGMAAGVCEEVIFRGIMFRYMKKTLGEKAAIIVPSIVFAAVHIMNMSQFDITDVVLLILAITSVAIMFTMMVISSDSIYPGVFSHAIWNILLIYGIFGIGDIVNGGANESFIKIPIESTSKLLTGGNFGIEAALPGMIGSIIVAIIIYMMDRNKKAQID